ncbi:MAG: S8 family serine peptidase [Armatimonadota bacterium]
MLSLALTAGVGAARQVEARDGAPPPPLSAAYAPDAVLVAFHPSAAPAARQGVVSRFGLEVDPSGQSPYFVRLRFGAGLRASGAGVPALIAALRRNPAVRVAEPSYLLRTSLVPNDPNFSSLWGLHNASDTDIDAPEAWNRTTGSDQVVVAVIDSGVDYNHPDLRDNILRDGSSRVVGYDYANNDSDPMDDHGHGTHCAGTIGARGNNSIGVVGVAHRVKIMPLKFLDASGSGYTDTAIQCIDFARTRGARIMSNSWGGGGYSQLLLEAIQRARDAGILFVAAAGNGGDDGVGDYNDWEPHYPANYNAWSDNVISVAATQRDDALCDFSNRGFESVDIAAPGESILSTARGGGYTYMSGTSMATPHVAGAAALVLSVEPRLTVGELKEQLLSSVDYPDPLSGQVRTGRLNVNGALTGGGTPLGDTFEPDDTADTASILGMGITQQHSFHIGGDEDWAWFQITTSMSLELATTGTTGDTVLELYGPNSSSQLLASNDDWGGSRFSRIELPRLAPGSYYVRVREYWRAPMEAYRLDLTLQPLGDAFEPDNTADTASILESGRSQLHSFHVAGDEDWARFTVTSLSSLQLATTGPIGDTVLELYGPGSSSQLLASNDDWGDSRFSLISILQLVPGTYYVRVRERHGSPIAEYGLHLTLQWPSDAFEPDDTADTASTLRSGERQQHSFHTGLDEDWARFTVTYPSSLELATTGTTGVTVLELYGPDSSSQLLASDNDWGDSPFARIELPRLAPGTYYVRVREFWNSPMEAYALHLTLQWLGDAFEPDDTAGTASTLRSGERQQHSFHTEQDEDWAQFTVTSPNSLELATNSRTVLELYGPDSSSQLLARNDEWWNGFYTTIELPRLAPGTYYVRVRDFHGVPVDAYELSLVLEELGPPAQEDAFEPDDEWSQAAAISVGRTQKRSLHHPEDVDWVKLTVRRRQRVIIETSGTQGDTVLELYGPKKASRRLAWDDDGGSNGFSRIKRTLPPGKYWIRVSAYDSGFEVPAYTLSVR